MTHAKLLATLFLLIASSASQTYARNLGDDVPSNTQPALDGDDDDEAFFSGGSNPAVPALASMSRRSPRVDAVSVCQAVLADEPGSYTPRFYEACRQIASRKPSRQVSSR